MTCPDADYDQMVYALDTGDFSAGDAERLLTLALSRPSDAMAQAMTLLANRPTAQQAAVAHQAIGVVLRDFGNVDQAVNQLRMALRWARRAGNPERESDIRASLGVALVMAGRTAHGLAALDEVINESIRRHQGRVPIGRLLIRRVWALWAVGRNEEALADANRAVAVLRGAGDPVWAARAYDHRATVQFARGAVERADRDYTRSEALFAEAGQRLEYADTRQERAAIAFVRGDIPAALALLDDAHRIVGELGVFEPELYVTRCTVLLASGLSGEAFAEIEAAVERSERQGGAVVRRAELLAAAARAANATGDFAAAERRAGQALVLFRRQRRPKWAGRAELVLLSAQHAAGDRSPKLLAQARRLAERLDEAGLPAAEGHLLAGQIALTAGRGHEAERQLQAAGAGRDPDLQSRIVRWLARATLASARQDWTAMQGSCHRGLNLIDLYLRTLGATELRAQATAHGAALVDIAVRHAVQRGNAWQALRWSERWRATVLAAPPVRPRADPGLVADLAALRHLAHRLDDLPSTGHVAPALYAERRRLEAAVRRRVLHAPAATVDSGTRFRSADLIHCLGDANLIELIEADGQLQAVVVGHGRARLVRIGPTADADRGLAHVLFMLRRASSSRRRFRRDSGPEAHSPTFPLDEIGTRLERHILGESASLLDPGRVVVVPPGRLHAVPWTMLPSLKDRDLTISPSATAWLRARRAVANSTRVVLVGGPRLSTGAEEVRRLAERYPDAVLLAGGDATAERVLAAIDGASLVHIAAHGTFRADSPLFSALELDDGPLTVYDLERLARAPHRVVLSSCNSAVGAPSGADELLGLVSALITLGSAGVLASVVRVDDPSTVPLMLDVHRHLSDGASLSQAHLLARQAARIDLVRRVTADSFVALGC